ncbi:MAG: class II aldolase/adducin family protein, partial [Bacteroidales bacterium]
MGNLLAEQPNVKRLLNDVATVAQSLWDRGWSERNAGNISVLLPQNMGDTHLSDEIPLEKPFANLEGKCFYMTGTGKRMQDIARSPIDNGLFVQISESGKSFRTCIQNHKVEPTSELPSHLGIHNMLAARGTGETVVLHTHATEVIALTQYSKIKSTGDLTRIIWSMHP